MNLIRLAPAKGGSTGGNGTPFAGVPFVFGWNGMNSLQINGRLRQFPDDQMPANLSALLEELQIGAAAVVAEVDGRIVRPEEFSLTEVRAGQTIELIKFMGGG
jgi:thiamine biosynthesis protein ThiS